MLSMCRVPMLRLARALDVSAAARPWARGFATALPDTDTVPEPTPYWEKKMFKRFEKMDFNKVQLLMHSI